MVVLDETGLINFAGHSSKGNQLKWKVEDIWYKADYTGYEALSEYMVSQLLLKSSLRQDEYVLYTIDEVKYKHSKYAVAVSDSFLEDNWQLITLQRLYETKYGRDFTKDVWHINSIEDRVKFIVDRVYDMTLLDSFGVYLSKMLTIDAFFLNEDRHLHNIAVLMGPGGSFDYCPYFDHGAGLLSDTTVDYPMGMDIDSLKNAVKGKTVCQDFDEVLDAAEKLYGQNIKFSFKKSDVKGLLENEKVYSPEIKERVANVIYEQMRKYQYLFS